MEANYILAGFMQAGSSFEIAYVERTKRQPLFITSNSLTNVIKQITRSMVVQMKFGFIKWRLTLPYVINLSKMIIRSNIILGNLFIA